MTIPAPAAAPAPARLLVPASALLWGLQVALLSPALAIILATLYDASTADIGWTLAVYHAGGFLAALLIPAWADRNRSYLQILLGCGVLTIALAGALATASSLPPATVALVVLGGPAGLGTTMLFAHLRDAGTTTSRIVGTRAIVSVAWVGGPPLATLIIGAAGGRGILAALVVIAVLNIATTAAMMARRRRLDRVAAPGPEARAPAEAPARPVSGRAATVLVVAAFVLFQACNATAMSFLTLYVSGTVGLAILWGGITLGVAAALEVPALLIIGRLGDRIPHLRLVALGAIAGVAYYIGLAAVTEPILLLALQPLNAISVAAISGIGLALFQDLIPGAGAATGLYMNTRRIGAVVSGPIIALGALPLLGQRGIFLACALLTLAGLGLVHAARRASRARASVPADG
ncbi:MFS transporter [Brachybacterium phenoliresistens]|uniref:MFS transporter n=1 Tax=Brachybacterium phenoliresistens TaxID=396014 RepID=Z9JWK9_9MICO|nr:MFS transporter [Brachybacterium phenoliresistens]EWS82167.1 MFS transporter [Brachybacterium phenoliresistens]